MNGSISDNRKVLDIRKLLRPMEGGLKLLLRSLVRTKSVSTPSDGDETPAQLVLRDFLLEHGVRSEMYATDFITKTECGFVQQGRRYRGRKNLCVRVTGAGRGKSLLMNGHMDTVPPGKARWTSSPWSGLSQKGRIYGLGSFDMKGGVVAQAAVVCALKIAGVRLGGDLIYESVVDEEWGGGGGTLAARLRGDSADACVVSEGTQLEIYRGTRGGFVVDLVIEAGDPSAYFSKAEIVSPAIPLGRLLGWVDHYSKQRQVLRPKGIYSTFPDPAPVQVLAVESNSLDVRVPLSVPSSATIRVYFQFLPEEDSNEVINEIQHSLRSFERADPFFKCHAIQWKPVFKHPLRGHELRVTHPWTQCMIGNATAMLGRIPEVTAAPYPCDAGLIHREFGIPTLVFGPKGAGAHNPDEYVEFKSVMQTAEVILSSVLQWCHG